MALIVTLVPSALLGQSPWAPGLSGAAEGRIERSEQKSLSPLNVRTRGSPCETDCETPEPRTASRNRTARSDAREENDKIVRISNAAQVVVLLILTV